MAYLLDTNAISEAFRRRPNPGFASWLRSLPRADQFTSTIVLSELYVVAYRSANSDKWFRCIEEEVLPVVTVLCFDPLCARLYGRLQGDLRTRGMPIDAPDAQIAATALHYNLVLVTGNVRHFERVPGLTLQTFQPGADGAFQLV